MSTDATLQILEELRALAKAMLLPGGALHLEAQTCEADSLPQGYVAKASTHVDPTASAGVDTSYDVARVPSACSSVIGEEGEEEEQEEDESTGDQESDNVADDDVAERQGDDGSYSDGVRTAVYFLPSDPERYEQVSKSLWAPEPVDSRPGCSVCVPMFPFGGGVTEGEEAYLLRFYTQLAVEGRRLREMGKSARNLKPQMQLAAEAFHQRRFQEVPPRGVAYHWEPDWITDFIIEVEDGVVFDAHAAKAERRLKLCESMAAAKDQTSMASLINLRIIMDPLKTGFEDAKELPIEPGMVVANRFQMCELLGQATFSRAVRALDLHQPILSESGDTEGYTEVCLKIINNTKEFFDQSLDEIRLLQLINSKMDPDEAHVVRLIDFFYFKEHVFLVTELLSDNLYEYAKYNREHEQENYFTLPRLRKIALQITEALAYIHSLNLMHCDLKPENILFVSHRRCIVKVIDFGSSCFLSDHLSSYIQSRSYRAPEVILGADYDGRIDVWSLGAILVELITGDVLFSSETVPEMLARISAVCGQPFPRSLLWEGRHTQDFFTKFGAIYEMGNNSDGNAEECVYVYYPQSPSASTSSSTESSRSYSGASSVGGEPACGPYAMLRAKLARHHVTDELLIDFIEKCLTLDHKLRPTSAELLQHPFLAEVAGGSPS